MTSSKDTAAAEHPFQAEVNQVLDIVIHSLYSHREIFLRELISNAADALDQLRFRAITEHDILPSDSKLAIRLIPDWERGTLTIVDNGIGMNEEELVRNLGTIAHSGSRRFLEALKEKGQGGEGVELIGQFGVGFYSAFLVADRVRVRSRRADGDQGYVWESEAKGSFTVAPDPEKTERGTEVELHLGEEHREYLDEWRLRELVRRYSDFVSHPIMLPKKRDEKDDKDEDADTGEWETINTARALWRRPRQEIEEKDYEEFYRHLTHDPEAPLGRAHFTIEGAQVFTCLLFIPREPPFELFDPTRRRGVRLYVKRVFIIDDCAELLPEWLRFLRGIVDSDDLPLNVSRELLQEDRIVRSIRKSIIGKTLNLLDWMVENQPEDYRKFWTNYGAILKEGLHYASEHRERLAKLVRYASSTHEFSSLADYVGRMTEGQEAIYYVTGMNRQSVEGSPHTEALRSRGFEVLYMTDPVDEWAVEGLGEFEGKKLVSAMRADLKLDEPATEAEKEKREEESARLGDLRERFQEILKDQISEVRLSRRLTESPCCLVVPEGGVHAHIERMLRARNKDMPATKRILELNPDHPVVERLQVLHAEDPKSDEVAEWARTLCDQALLAEGSEIADPAGFARRIGRLMTRALGVGPKSAEEG